MGKRFLNKTDFSSPSQAYDFYVNFLRKAQNYDKFEKQTSFTAIVLTRPIELARADLDVTFSPPEPGSNSISKFAFKGRIVDQNSPHQYLPNPCTNKVAKSMDTQGLLKLYAMHTTFISSDDYSVSSAGQPKAGDIVNVELDVNVNSYNLQFGRFISIASDTKGGGGSVGELSEACVNMEALFNKKFDYKSLGKEIDLSAAAKAAASAKGGRTRKITPKKPPPGAPPPAAPTKDPGTVTATDAAKYSKLYFGDSQMEGEYGAIVEQFFGKPNSTRIAKHSTQPRDWRRCVGDKTCKATSVAVPAKVKQVWAAIDRVPDLLVISLAGNGVSHLDDLISEISAAIDGKKTKVIWQGAPPPIHKTDSGAGTFYYGKLSKYNTYYKSRHANSMKVKAKVEAKGWLFIDPYEYLLLSDGKTAGYVCKGRKIDKCDGVHLTKAAAKQLVMAEYPKILPEEYKVFLE